MTAEHTEQSLKFKKCTVIGKQGRGLTNLVGDTAVKKETDLITLIKTPTGYFHSSGYGVFPVFSMLYPSTQEQFDHHEIIAFTQDLMTILIASGRSRSELERIFMEFLKEKEDGEQ